MDSTPPSSPRRRDRSRPPDLRVDAHHTTAALFSPDSKSADTDGTGATGSTEPPGAATRSLVESVHAREDAAAAAARGSFDVLLDDDDDVPPAIPLAGSRRDSDESWHCVGVEQTAFGGAEQMETTPAVHLPTPEPEERFRPSAFQAADIERDLHASDSASNPLDGQISKVDFDSDDERQILAAPPSLLERDALEQDGLTDSQEDVLLAQSVTRSQSDFSHWLHETLRLAQGDGTSTIESDDALSSILEVTRHVRLGEAANGFGEESRLTERASMLEFDVDAMPDEDITISTIPSVPVHSPGVESDKSEVSPSTVAAAPDSAEENEHVEGIPDRQSKTSVPKHRVWPWQMFSLVLAVFLAYQHWEHMKARAEAAPISSPTRSIAYAPLNRSVEVSTFPTPYAVGPRVHPGWYTFVLTLLAASGAAIPSLLHRRSSRPTASPPLRERSPSTGTVAFELAEARSQLQVGIKFYSRGRSQDAIRTFSAVLELACPPSDKAIASEWLGRAHYRLGRLGDRNAREHFARSVKAFERSIRLDPGRATPRASLGRTLFRLGDYAGAAKALRAALKRDDQLAFAHEWLAKALSRLEPLAGDLVERHLKRAVEVDPNLYTAHAFLGEYLHLRGGGAGRTEAAKACLLRAIALRSDYPAAHVRLAFIANEQLDSTAAAQHYAAAIATRHTGLRDPAVMPASEAALDGTSPFLACYFAMPTRSPRRLAILRQASSEHPFDEVLSLLLAIESTPTTRTAHASSPVAAVDDGIFEREALLSRRVARYSPSEDIIAHGLFALVLLTLGKDTAESAYQRFWTAVIQRRRDLSARDKVPEATTIDDEVDRIVAYLAMAFFERRAMPVPTPRVEAPLTPAPKSPSLPRSKKCLTRSGSSIKTPARTSKDDRTPSLSPSTPTTTLRRSTRRAKAALH